MILAGLQPLHEILRIEIGPDRIFSKQIARHEGVSLVIRVKIVDLRLDRVSIGVLVVHTDSRPVVGAPRRLHAQCLALQISLRKVIKGVEAKGDMLEARRGGHPWAGVGDFDYGNAVVLVIGADECEVLVLVSYLAAEES